MRKKMIAVSVSMLFVCSVFLMMAGCAKKQVASQVTHEIDTGRAHTGGDADSEAVRNARLEDLNAAKQAAENSISSKKIYFEFDSSELSAEAQTVLKEIAAVLQSSPSYSLDISGHCDERGTIEYNLALGERRARSAKNFLVSLGITGDRISTISYGEEKPVDTASTEEAWAKNRRDEFLLIK
jgi:peptidoglycan-associated lipoprotein